MSVNQCGGWVLVLGAVLLLITRGRADLLVILIPLSLLLAFVIGCSKQQETGLTSDGKKG
jgi:Cu/Ag efflux pump CusA